MFHLVRIRPGGFEAPIPLSRFEWFGSGNGNRLDKGNEGVWEMKRARKRKEEAGIRLRSKRRGDVGDRYD